MARKLPLAAVRDLTAQHSSAVYVGLMTVHAIDGGEPQRICTDPAQRLGVDPLRYGIISRGLRFDYVPMRLALPGSDIHALPAASLEAEPDPEIVEAVRTSIYRATLDIETVFSTRPNQVLEFFPGLEVVEASWNDDAVTIAVGYPTLETTPLVRHRLTTAVCPALRDIAQG